MAVTDVLPAADPKALRDEYDELNQFLRRHHEKKPGAELEVATYQRYLRRSLAILQHLNHTTAGPKKTTSKAKAAPKDATPLSLSDI